ncbi:MAG: D-alanyl-D-alanine carboxypeptidase [Firmicutes bacterium]|nr:D-alanyl-D-alanine carboxypeptidase [Bacillota bacterium]
MKKLLFFIVLFFVCFKVSALDLGSAKSGLLMEYSTGKVLYELNSHERLAPASMTKIMTMLLVMEKIDEGKISMDSLVNISNNASSMGGSQMFLEENSNIKVSELLKGISIASANDAAVALAEYVGGSLDNFVKMMNDKVEELGLKDTHFNNVHGLDSDGHYSSAYDMAIMARELIKHSDILKFTSTYEDYFNKEDGSRTWLVNTNRLVRFYKGVDGLKTGYTNNAKYCLTATAMKNNIRFISVLMGVDTSDERSKITSELLNYAFNSYKLNNILNKTSDLGNIYVEKGNREYAKLSIKEDINEVEEINSDNKKYTFKIKKDVVKAPISKGTKVGSVEIIDSDNNIIREEDLIIGKDINKISFMKLLFKNLRVLLTGI